MPCTISYHVPGCTCFGPNPIAAKKTPRSKKPCKAIRQTDRDLKRLDDEVERCALAMGGRFGDIDDGLVRMADDLLATVRQWATEVREYMAERAADGERWEL